MTDRMELIGFVLDHSRDIFRVKVEGTDQIVTAKLSGKMRQNKIDLQVGDRVKLEVSPYDTGMGRITFRISSSREYYASLEGDDRGPIGSAPPRRKQRVRSRNSAED